MGRRAAAAGPSASAKTPPPKRQKKSDAQQAEDVVEHVPDDLEHDEDTVLPASANPSQFLVNAGHWSAVERAWKTITTHQVFQGIVNEMPLSLGESSIPPFSASDFQKAIDGTGTYTAGGNAMWCSPFFTTTPGVPINTHGAGRLLCCQTSVHSELWLCL
jgi:hypothetical protein